MKRLIMILLAIGAAALQAHPAGAQHKEPEAADANQQHARKPGTRSPCPPGLVMMVLDRDRNGVLTAIEINNASASLRLLDQNGDGMVDRNEQRFMILPGMGQGYEGKEIPTGLPPMREDRVPPGKKN